MRRILALMILVFVVGVFARRHVLASEFAGFENALAASHGAASARRAHLDDLPPSATTAADQLAKSPRHREYVLIPTPGVPGDSIRAWVFYPQVSGKTPVVVVIHEIFGMTTWIKAIGDQVAAEGFIAIVPDLIHRKIGPGEPDTIAQDAGVTAIRALDPAAVQRDIFAAANYATHLPAALPMYATVGFCWGGGVSFAQAVFTPPAPTPQFKAAVVYYGVQPDSTLLPTARGAVLGLYAGNDARISTTVPGTAAIMDRLHKTYRDTIYAGAGHGFLRAQDGQNGANAAATSDAWPRTIAWFRKYLAG
jgi:carboxymethylenebutenolidase